MELLSCTKLLLIAEEQPEISCKKNAACAESRILKKMDNASSALKVIKVDCGMLKYKAIMGDGIGSAIKA